MRIRPYIPNKDYEYVSKWIDNERTHAFWCASLLSYSMTRKSFHILLGKNAMGGQQYAVQITGIKAVQLNVFSENTLAKHCYEKIG